jgi:hypothetical protein
MELLLGGSVLRISHLGPGHLVLVEPVDHPTAHAEILMAIDDSERRWTVDLPDGLSIDSPRTRIARPRSESSEATVS